MAKDVNLIVNERISQWKHIAHMQAPTILRLEELWYIGKEEKNLDKWISLTISLVTCWKTRQNKKTGSNSFKLSVQAMLPALNRILDPAVTLKHWQKNQ